MSKHTFYILSIGGSLLVLWLALSFPSKLMWSIPLVKAAATSLTVHAFFSYIEFWTRQRQSALESTSGTSECRAMQEFVLWEERRQRIRLGVDPDAIKRRPSPLLGVETQRNGNGSLHAWKKGIISVIILFGILGFAFVIRSESRNSSYSSPTFREPAALAIPRRSDGNIEKLVDAPPNASATPVAPIKVFPAFRESEVHVEKNRAEPADPLLYTGPKKGPRPTYQNNNKP